MLALCWHSYAPVSASRTQLAEQILVGVVEGWVGHAPNDAHQGIKYHLRWFFTCRILAEPLTGFQHRCVLLCSSMFVPWFSMFVCLGKLVEAHWLQPTHVSVLVIRSGTKSFHSIVGANCWKAGRGKIQRARVCLLCFIVIGHDRNI